MPEFSNERFEQSDQRHNPETQRFIERKESRVLTLAEQISEKDIQYFYKSLTPKLQDFREFVFSLAKIDPAEQEVQKEAQKNSFKIAMSTTLYEVRNVPKTMIAQHFKDTMADVFAPQERALELKKSMLLRFKDSPDEKRAEEFVWKCNYYLEQIGILKKNFAQSIEQNTPSTTIALQESYLQIMDTLWEHRAVFSDPNEWLQEFVGNIAKNDQDAADSLLQQLDVA